MKERLKKFLADEKAKMIDMKKLSEQTGILYQTLYMFKRGMANPNKDTIDKLDAYLKSKGY